MKKLHLSILILIILISVTKNSNAVTVSITLPTTNNGAVNTELTTNAATYTTTLTSEVNKKVGNFGSMDKIAMGMSNANAYSSSSSSLNGYQGYSIWAAVVGLTASAQVYSYDINQISNIIKTFSNDGNIYLGLGTGASANVGIHIGHFIKPLDGLYINLKVMYLPSIPIPLGNIGKITPSNITAGAGVNYQLIKRREWIGGLFGWGGLSIGSGFIYTNNDMRVELNQLGSISTDIGGLASFSVAPTIDLLIKNNTFTVPIDLVTSIKLLWVLNITAGIGADFNFGTTSIAINSKNALRVKDNAGVDITTTPGSVNLSVNPTQPPAIFTPKVLLGVGFKIWAIVIDVPVTLYFPIHQNLSISQSGIGVSAGVTIGAVW